MAGFYIHIPFCRKLCYYCDFHFTVSFKYKERVVEALKKEIKNRKIEFQNVEFNTVYFGGGTPSVLTIREVQEILGVIYENYTIRASEITFEANPDDLTNEYLNELKNYTPVNRLSIGVQSFHDRDLQLMNRRHTAKEAIQSIELSRKAGFDNINIDLIYGIPGLTISNWKDNLELFNRLNLNHLSAYHLTFEPKTVFSYYVKKGKMKPLDEEKSLRQFELLMRFAEDKGFEHYEISNFARNNMYSRHNTGYWSGEPYIGIGPSAHSFNKKYRRWNVSNNTKYCEAIGNNSDDYFESETIDQQTAYNELILTSLRTKWGINDRIISQRFGDDILTKFVKMASRFIDDGTLTYEGGSYFLSNKGKFIADHIMSELMIV